MAILNVSNLGATDKRVKLIPHPGATISETEPLAPNPSLVLDDLDENYAFCLKGKVLAVGCAGATHLATVTLSGNFDIVIDGKMILENMNINDIVLYFSQVYGEEGQMGDPYPIDMSAESGMNGPFSFGIFCIPTDFGGRPAFPPLN